MPTARPRIVPVDQSLAARFPDLVQEWDRRRNGKVDPTAISPNTHFKAAWRCRTCRHRWVAQVQNRTARSSGCPVCALKRRARTQAQVEESRSIALLAPELARELHPELNPGIDPHTVAGASSQKLWWRCGQCGHEWEAVVSNRARHGTGCPKCALADRSSR